MKTALALGTFDGVHQGHRAVLAQTASYNSVAVTFCIPPKAVNGNENSLIMMPDDKVSALKQIGISKVEMLDFDKVKNLEPLEFLCLLEERFAFDKIVCGFNYRFGAKAKGDADFIKLYCKEHKKEFVCVDAVKEQGGVISSTNIRKLIEQGDIKEANRFIFGGFGFSSKVLSGDQRGRDMGFPTINQEYPKMLCVPRFGVYKSEVIVDEKHYKAITNLGHRPTFRTKEIFCETHIFGFSGNIYGMNVTLKLLEFLREEKKFDSIEELKNQIKKDIQIIEN